MINEEPEAPKKVYRVRSRHHKFGTNGGSYVRTRHFFSRYNAFRSYNRLLKEIEAPNYSSIAGQWGKVLAVEISESQPVVFTEDFTLSSLDICQAKPHTGHVATSLSGGTS